MTHRDLLAVCDLEIATAKRLALCEPFICENEDLNDFFANDAVVFSKYLLGKTYLLCLKENPKIIVDAYNNEATIHYYLKNDFRFLVEDERLEAKYMGIGVGRLPLNTRLMYFDLLDMQPLPGYDEE